MKFEPVTKLDKKLNNVKKIDNDVMSENHDVIFIFLIYGQFGAILKPNSGRMACNFYIFINSYVLSYRN